jgi:hypothetical protein
MRTGGLTGLLVIALTILLVTRGAAQPRSPQSFLEWLAVAVEAENEQRYRDAARAYMQALAFRPLDPTLNLTLYRYEGSPDYLLRAAEGLLKEPRTDTEIVRRLCDGLMGRYSFDERDRPIPLMLLPPQARKTIVQRFGKWLFPDLLSEAQYRFAEGERDRAVSLLRQIVLAGEPFAPDELFWRMALGRDDYLRRIAADWERDALKTKNPYLFIAVLNIYRHLNDLSSIRRLFPHALAAAQGSRRSRQLLGFCMERTGWKEGMAAVRTEQEEFGDSPLLLGRQAADAAQQGQIERVKRLVLRYSAEYPWDAPIPFRQYFATSGWHDLPDSEAGSEAGADTITRMLIRHLNHPDQFRYWLKMAVIQGTQRFPRTSIPEEVLSEYVERNLPPDYLVVIVERILPLLKEMGLPQRLLETQTRRLSDACISAYHQLGYYRLANRLSQQKSSLPPSESVWQAVLVGWERTAAQDESMAYTVDGVGHHTSRSSRLLGTILHMAHALVKEGRSREASRVASSELSGYPREWREGLVHAVAFFEKGIPAIVPFAQWLGKMAATDSALVTTGYHILKSLVGDELAQAAVVALLAVMPEPRHPTEQMRVNLESILRPPTLFGLSQLDLRQPPSILDPLPPPPRSVALLAEHLPPQLWDSRFFSRLGSPWLSAYHEPFVRRYPNTAACVLHRLWQTNRTSDKNAVRRELRALRKARHWHTVDWRRIPPLSETVLSAASKQEALELLDIVSVHAPKEVRPVLQQQKLILMAHPPDAPPLPVQVMLLEEAVWNRPVSLEQKVDAVQEITFAAPEAAAVLLEKMLPELLEYGADHRHWNILFLRYCWTLLDVVERRPTLAPKLRPLFERAIAQSAVLKRELVFERATLATMAGKPQRAAEYLLQVLRQPDSARGGRSWALLFAALVKLPLPSEGYRQLQAATEEWLREEQPSLSRIEGILKEIPNYGINIVYTGGRRTYHGYASEEGLRILAQTLTRYVQQFPGVIPVPFVKTIVGHARTVYSRDDVAGAAPAWKELMHACLRDILLLSPEDARQLADSLRIMHLPSTDYAWAQAFRRDLEEIITLLQSGGERS